MIVPEVCSLVVMCACACMLVGCMSSEQRAVPKESSTPIAATGSGINLGNFSVSLNVKNLIESIAFYEKLGFVRSGGDGKRYIIMQNPTATIGLFQGMFERNSLTFNPGWDRNKQTVPGFTDVRELQSILLSRGLTSTPSADPASTGPAYIVLTDPDGNPILIDQHVDKPAVSK